MAEAVGKDLCHLPSKDEQLNYFTSLFPKLEGEKPTARPSIPPPQDGIREECAELMECFNFSL